MEEKSPVFYKPTGKVSFLKFLPLVVLSCFTAIFMAVVLLICDSFNFYYFIFVPLIVAAPVYGMLFLSIHFGACRNRIIAILCAIICILVYYTGYWTFSYGINIVAEGPEAVKYMEKVAGAKGVIGYFIYRCKTNIVTDDTFKKDKKQPEFSDSVESYIFYSAELLLLLGLAITMGITLPARIYFEKEKNWASATEIRLIPQELGKALEAIRNNNWRTFSTIPKLPKIGNNNAFNAFLSLKFEYLKNSPDTPVYVTLTGANMGKNPVAKAEGAKGLTKAFIRQLMIEEQFYPELALVFPELELGIEPAAASASASITGQPLTQMSAAETENASATAPISPSRPKYSAGFAGLMEKIGIKQPEFIGPDFRNNAVESSKLIIRKAGNMAAPTDMHASLCIPVPEDEKIDPGEVSGINFLALFLFLVCFLGGMVLLIFSEDKTGSTKPEILIPGLIVLVASFALLFYGLGWRQFRAKHKLLNRANSLFDSFANQKKELLRIESPQSYHIHKRIPEDVVCCLYDQQNSRLLLEGCNYRYIIKGEDLTRIEPLESGQVVSIHLAYKIQDQELGLIIYKQSTGGTILNPLLTMNAAKSFVKKIRQTLNIKET